jgi:electron transfer flavoprotein alpha subunit
MNILVFVTTGEGRVRRGSVEVLSRMRVLAAERGGTLSAVVLSENTVAFTAEIAKYGPARIYAVTGADLDVHLNARTLAALEPVLKQARPDLIAFTSTEATKDVLGALAHRLGGAALPEALGVEIQDDGSVEVQRPVMAGKAIARVRARQQPVLVSVRGGVYEAEEEPGSPEIIDIAYEGAPDSQGPRLREVVRAVSGGVDLAEARVVVAAGRGVRDERGRDLVNELARVLGAAVGSSRAVVENGLFEASTQIGQTGKTVAPDLYVGVGISGAIQHVSGMTGSRKVIAINRDADAPIFQYADIGMVGDLYEIVPALINELSGS